MLEHSQHEAKATPDPESAGHRDFRHRPVRWQVRLARTARQLHKWIGMILALVMAVLSVTGGFVAFKKQVEYLQPASRVGTEGPIREMIPPWQVADIILSLRLPGIEGPGDIDRIELRPGKRMYKVRLVQAGSWASPRELQVDALSGAVLNSGLRGDQLWMDIHSFAVFGEFTKLVVMSLAALALLWLGLSGLYLFFFPPWFRANKRRRTDSSPP